MNQSDIQADGMKTASGDLYVASLLANFFEAGWAIQVLVGDATQAQYDASRLTRPKAEKHLREMVETARSLPLVLRQQMPKVDWQSWVELGDYLPPQDARARALVWTAIDMWLPTAGRELRLYRRQLPQLWRFTL